MRSFEDRIDPELRSAFDATQGYNIKLEHVPRARAGLEQQRLQERPQRIPDNVRLEDHHANAADGHEIWIRVYRPTDVEGQVGGYYYMHGGGMMFHSPALSDGLCAAVAGRLGVVVASVDYRLAPEHPFPTPLEDCATGYLWFLDRADEFGVDTSRIGIGGASAGGGLAAGLALAIRERSLPAPVLQLLTYPMIDDRNETASSHYVTEPRVWNRQKNLMGWTAYLGEEPGGQDVSHLAAPARATDLSGLPPAVITVGELDMFLDEDLGYAERLLVAGVPVEVHVYAGAYHGCQGASPGARVVRRWQRDEFDALDRALNS